MGRDMNFTLRRRRRKKERWRAPCPWGWWWRRSPVVNPIKSAVQTLGEEEELYYRKENHISLTKGKAAFDVDLSFRFFFSAESSSFVLVSV